MSRLGGAGRRPDHWSSVHERARVRAAERLEAPLKPSEAAWLEGHLRECAACTAIATAYAADRAMLRRLRDANPEPPRDLWAMTAAQIERESQARRHGRGRAVPPPSRPTLGALSAIAVVAVVLVATALSGGLLGGHDIALASSHPTGTPAASHNAAPTAIAVGAGEVRWLGVRDDGAFAYNVADIDAVCPPNRQPDCAPFADGHARRVTLTAVPKFVFQSPVEDQAVVVGTDASGADAVIVVALPATEPEPGSSEPGSSPSPVPSERALASDGTASIAGASDSPAATLPAPSDTTSDNAIDPVPGLLASASPGSEPAASTGSEPSVSPGSEPSAGTAVAIITNVTIVGRSAGYSPDGAWFAFSARPADGSAGPDIYAWHVGNPLAVALTNDHASVFASWIGDRLLGSRAATGEVIQPPQPEASLPADASSPAAPTPSPTPSPSPSPALAPTAESSPDIGASASPGPAPAPEFAAETFLIDPLTRSQTPTLGEDWHPVVDPTGAWVAAWDGTVSLGLDGWSMVPASGRLVIRPFQALAEPSASPSPLEQPVDTPIAAASDSPSDQPPSPSGASAAPDGSQAPGPQVIAEGPIADFDARWDDTGTWLAVWIGDPVDPSIGRLSLLHVDPISGLIDRPLGAPQDVPALPGFSIGAGRLAWATPPGQAGEGSRIQIVAWTEEAVGGVESIPVEGAIVIQ
jgi:hypothetical protein